MFGWLKSLFGGEPVQEPVVLPPLPPKVKKTVKKAEKPATKKAAPKEKTVKAPRNIPVVETVNASVAEVAESVSVVDVVLKKKSGRPKKV